MQGGEPAGPMGFFWMMLWVRPEVHQEVCAHIRWGHDQLMRTMPGYVSASLYPGCDGQTVLYQVQWKTQLQAQAVLAHPLVVAHFQEVFALSEQKAVGCAQWCPLDVRASYETSARPVRRCALL